MREACQDRDGWRTHTESKMTLMVLGTAGTAALYAKVMAGEGLLWSAVSTMNLSYHFLNLVMLFKNAAVE